MKITRELLCRWGACYDDARIAELVPEAGLTPLEVSELHIPAEDRLWVLLHEEIVPACDLRLLACGWAEAACVKAGCNDARSLNAIAVGRRYAHGEATEAELASARSAAESAEAWSAWAAAWEAARSAAWSAAWSAAEAEAADRSEQLADVVLAIKRKIEGGTSE